jgi:hypothetical protein
MAVDTENAQTTGGGTETTGAGPHDQFLGIEPELDAGGTETESTESPETTETEGESTESTEGEETEQGETETEGEGEEETTEEEADDNWLPDEQAKQYPLEVLTDYAKRRGFKWTAEQIAQDGDLQKLLKSKLDTDIYVRNLEQQGNEDAELEDDQDETTDVDETAATETAATTTSAAKDPRAAHYERVDQIVAKGLDQNSVTELGKGLLEAMGVNTDTEKLQTMLASPKLTAEQRAEVQSALTLAKGAGKIGQVIARGGVDLVMSVLPDLLPEMIERIFPGTQARFEAGVYAGAWQQVQGAVGKDSKPVYQNLPAYGSQEFRQLLVKAERQLGLPEEGLFNLVLRDKGGKALPLEQQAIAKYRMVARVAAGQRVTPAAVVQAVETGKRQATVAAQKRAAGRAMGSGQTSRQFDQKSDDDPMMSELRNQIIQQNQDELPVSNLLKK